MGENDSVDIVFDNHGAQGTADQIMHAIRPGGAFQVLNGGGGGRPSENPKEGVTQSSCNYGNHLDSLKSMFEQEMISARTMQQRYNLAEVPAAFTRARSRGVLGKISVCPWLQAGGAVGLGESDLSCPRAFFFCY